MSSKDSWKKNMKPLKEIDFWWLLWTWRLEESQWMGTMTIRGSQETIDRRYVGFIWFISTLALKKKDCLLLERRKKWSWVKSLWIHVSFPSSFLGGTTTQKQFYGAIFTSRQVHFFLLCLHAQPLTENCSLWNNLRLVVVCMGGGGGEIRVGQYSLSGRFILGYLIS